MTNNHESFDALVEFDGSSDSGYKKKTVTNNEQGKNDYLSPNISNLDTKSNILFIVPKEKYLNEFKKIMDCLTGNIEWHTLNGKMTETTIVVLLIQKNIKNC